MHSLIERIQSWLSRAGWAVQERRTLQPDNPSASNHLLMLQSTRVPCGVKVDVEVRIHNGFYSWRLDERLLGVTVHYPPRPGDAGPIPEAHLTGEEAQPENYRQLNRVLTWFHDPLSGALWEERPRQGDWQPPASWEADRWGPRFTIEHRWAICVEPANMLLALPGQPDERKLQLLACACCRRLPRVMDHEPNRLAVEAAERHADGLTPRREMKKVCKHSGLDWLARVRGVPLALRAVAVLVEACPTEGPRLAADLIRDVMGDPFHLVHLRPSWLRQNGGTVRCLATVIMAEGRSDEMPVLGDALEDAGCANAAVLDHCRGPGPHVRGCWVLDALTGRSRPTLHSRA